MDRVFLSQICYEHGERFNRYFPKFDISKHNIQRQLVTALDIQTCVSYDQNLPVIDWAEQFDEYRQSGSCRYINFEHMISKLTWPFPPVIINNANGFAESLSSYSLGKPWHLVEGTHRVSYLNRMLELGLIEPSSKHEIIWLCG